MLLRHLLISMAARFTDAAADAGAATYALLNRLYGFEPLPRAPAAHVSRSARGTTMGAWLQSSLTPFVLVRDLQLGESLTRLQAATRQLREATASMQEPANLLLEEEEEGTASQAEGRMTRVLLDRVKQIKARLQRDEADRRARRAREALAPLQAASDRARSTEKRRLRARHDAVTRRRTPPTKTGTTIVLRIAPPAKPGAAARIVVARPAAAPSGAVVPRPRAPPTAPVAAVGPVLPPRAVVRRRPLSPLAGPAAVDASGGSGLVPAAAGGSPVRVRRNWRHSDPDDLRRWACLRASRKGAPMKP